jgi:hypothetical protein
MRARGARIRDGLIPFSFGRRLPRFGFPQAVNIPEPTQSPEDWAARGVK